MIAEKEPEAVHAILEGGGKALYLDVRTTAEFERGHPAGAFHIPILIAGSRGMQQNPEFSRVAEAALPRDHTLLVGCKSGQRSLLACELLEDLGFEHLVNVTGGFGGSMDPMTGRVMVRGWEECGLPVATKPLEGRSWEALRLRVDPDR